MLEFDLDAVDLVTYGVLTKNKPNDSICLLNALITNSFTSCNNCKFRTDEYNDCTKNCVDAII